MSNAVILTPTRDEVLWVGHVSDWTPDASGRVVVTDRNGAAHLVTADRVRRSATEAEDRRRNALQASI